MSLTAPLFSPKKVIVDNIGFDDFPIKAFNNAGQVCELQHTKEVEIDIDHDGDLDLFKGRFLFGKVSLVNPFEFHEKTENGLEKTDNMFGLPSTTDTLAFVDIDRDGDDDVFINGINQFYENIGTLKQAVFIEQESPLKCENKTVTREAVIDLNRDHQIDLVCGNGDKIVILSSPDGYKKNNHLFQDSP